MLSKWGGVARCLGNPTVRSIHQGKEVTEAYTFGWRGLGPLYTEHMDFHCQSPDSSSTPLLAVVLHGLLGAGRNLRSFASELFSSVSNVSRSTWKVVLVDLRCHGRSAKERLHGPHSMENVARDVISTVHANWPNGKINVLIGHSLGGKVALEVTRALGYPAEKSAATPYGTYAHRTGHSLLHMPPPQQTWTLDSIPGIIPDPPTGTSAEVLNVLTEVSKIPQPLSSRDELFKHLDAVGLRGIGFQKWLASNLIARSKNEYVFAFDIPGVKEMFDSYRRTEYWNLLQHPPEKTEIHIVKAMRGGRWKGEMSNRLSAAAAASQGKTVLHEMPHAGHWLHAEDPKGLAAIMAPVVARTTMA